MIRRASNHPDRAAALVIAGRIVLLGLIALGFDQSRSHAQSESVPEYHVKAAFLFNIVKYSEWPEGALSTGEPMKLGVLGEDPFGHALDALVKGRKVSDRRVVVRRGVQISELRDCHVIFISASERDRAPQICTRAESWNAITVGDTSQVEPYVAINFSVEGRRIVFSANLDAAKRAGVRISSKLLHLAQSVRGANGTGGGGR
jgi:hypothetical protein